MDAAQESVSLVAGYCNSANDCLPFRYNSRCRTTPSLLSSTSSKVHPRQLGVVPPRSPLSPLPSCRYTQSWSLDPPGDTQHDPPPQSMGWQSINSQNRGIPRQYCSHFLRHYHISQVTSSYISIDLMVITIWYMFSTVSGSLTGGGGPSQLLGALGAMGSDPQQVQLQ